MKILTWFSMVLSVFLLIACTQGPESPQGFSLPKGDLAKGEAVFMKYQCLTCHTLTGYEDETLAKEFDMPIPLGGLTTKVKTYGELVASVINPSHKIAPRNSTIEEKITNPDGSSKMQVFNDVMTVQELIDIVAFLQPKYEVMPLTYTNYGQYKVM